MTDKNPIDSTEPLLMRPPTVEYVGVRKSSKPIGPSNRLINNYPDALGDGLLVALISLFWLCVGLSVGLSL